MDEGKIRQHSVCGDACKCKDGIGLILFFYLKFNTWNVQKMSSRREADLLPPYHQFKVQQQNDSLEVGTVTKQSCLLTPWTPQHLSEIRFFKVGTGLPDDKGSTRCSQQLTYYASVIF